VRRHSRSRVSLLAVGLLAGCATAPAAPPADVASTPTVARAADGRWISWVEHRIDDEGLSGLPLRGADGLKLADIDRDGLEDVVSAHEDSRHVRIAFRSKDLRRWTSVTVAEGDEADTAEDVAIADLNGDGWLDVLIACEKGHLLYLQNPGPGARTQRWARLAVPQTRGRGSWIRVFAADFNGDGRWRWRRRTRAWSTRAGPRRFSPSPCSAWTARRCSAFRGGSRWWRGFQSQ
jgi:hypothetical protein